MNRYPKPPLQLDYWCVSRKDLYMVYEFMRERFPEEPVDIIVETQDGSHNIFRNFQEFEQAIEVSLSLSDKVLKISMYAREVKLEVGQRRFIWFVVELLFNAARFNVFAQDEQGELRHWADESYKEMQRLFGLFQPGPGFQDILRRDFNIFYPDRRHRDGHGVVVLDYDGNIKNRIHNELASGPRAEEKPGSNIRMRWIYDRSIWLGIISATLLFALLVLTVYF